MKKFGIILAVALLLFVAVQLQPYRYYPYGFDEVTLKMPIGVLRLELTDYTRTKTKTHCLLSFFNTSEQSGEPITITILRASTASVPILISNAKSTGLTQPIGTSQTSSYFYPDPIGKLAFPTDEAIEIEGTIQYKGATYPLHTTLKLRYWAERREAISFCA